jgi:hypothetical protein
MATVNSGICAAAVCKAVVLLQVRSRRIPFEPKVLSKYVRGVAPVPPVLVGSSAPESVDVTLTRKTLIAA